MEPFLFKDSSGKKSVTTTAFIFGSAIVNIKLIFSGISIGSFVFEKFAGSEYGMAMAALGSIYVLNKKTKPEKKEEV